MADGPARLYEGDDEEACDVKGVFVNDATSTQVRFTGEKVSRKDLKIHH